MPVPAGVEAAAQPWPPAPRVSPARCAGGIVRDPADVALPPPSPAAGKHGRRASPPRGPASPPVFSTGPASKLWAPQPSWPPAPSEVPGADAAAGGARAQLLAEATATSDVMRLRAIVGQLAVEQDAADGDLPRALAALDQCRKEKRSLEKLHLEGQYEISQLQRRLQQQEQTILTLQQDGATPPDDVLEHLHALAHDLSLQQQDAAILRQQLSARIAELKAAHGDIARLTQRLTEAERQAAASPRTDERCRLLEAEVRLEAERRVEAERRLENDLRTVRGAMAKDRAALTAAAASEEVQRQRVEELHAARQQLETELRDVAQRRGALAEEHRDLQARLSQAQRSGDEAARQMDDVSAAAVRLRVERDDLMGKCAGLSAEASSLRIELQSRDDALRARESDAAALQQLVDDIGAEKRRIDEERRTLTRDLQASERRAAALDQEVGHLRASALGVDEDRTQLEERVREQEQRMRDLTDGLRQKEVAAAAASKRYEDMCKERQELRGERDGLRRELDEVTARAASEADARSLAAAEAARLSERVELSERSVRERSSDADALRRQADALERDLVQTRRVSSDLDGELRVCREQVSQLQSDLATARAAAATAELQIQRADQALSEAGAKVQAAEEQAGADREAAAAVEREREDLIRRVADAEHRLKRTEEKGAAEAAAAEDLRTALVDRDTEIGLSRRQSEKLGSEVTELSQRLAEYHDMEGKVGRFEEDVAGLRRQRIDDCAARLRHCQRDEQRQRAELRAAWADSADVVAVFSASLRALRNTETIAARTLRASHEMSVASLREEHARALAAEASKKRQLQEDRDRAEAERVGVEQRLAMMTREAEESLRRADGERSGAAEDLRQSFAREQRMAEELKEAKRVAARAVSEADTFRAALGDQEELREQTERRDAEHRAEIARLRRECDSLKEDRSVRRGSSHLEGPHNRLQEALLMRRLSPRGRAASPSSAAFSVCSDSSGQRVGGRWHQEETQRQLRKAIDVAQRTRGRSSQAQPLPRAELSPPAPALSPPQRRASRPRAASPTDGRRSRSAGGPRRCAPTPSPAGPSHRIRSPEGRDALSDLLPSVAPLLTPLRGALGLGTRSLSPAHQTPSPRHVDDELREDAEPAEPAVSPVPLHPRRLQPSPLTPPQHRDPNRAASPPSTHRPFSRMRLLARTLSPPRRR
eukprot:TRINITY_DN16002_c1_g1_i1.p1 TRINITY_DN16002_c1_g1~~TRINITY_DN16002_c1_g1_i1.p1  ORF type:complete len:1198 (+),score=521.81 TRINITY_DN16002_c1_g1_i1:53-3595(+)